MTVTTVIGGRVNVRSLWCVCAVRLLRAYGVYVYGAHVQTTCDANSGFVVVLVHVYDVGCQVLR